jgi:hypothetical protein
VIICGISDEKEKRNKTKEKREKRIEVHKLQIYDYLRNQREKGKETREKMFIQFKFMTICEISENKER